MNTCPNFEKFSPFAADQVSDPFSVLAAARASQPVFFSRELGMWVVTRHADVKFIYENAEIFSNSAVLASRTDVPAAILAEFGDWRPPLEKEVVMSDPPQHTRLKRLMMAAFTPGRVAKFEPWIREIVEDLLDQITPGEEHDIVASFTSTLPPLVIARLLGVPREDATNFAKWVGDIVTLAGTWQLSEDDMIACWRGVRAFEDYIRDVIAHRRTNLGEDVVSYLIEAKGEADEPALDEEELLHNVVNIAGAGADSTGNLMAVALYSLLSRSDDWNRIVADRRLIPAALEESLRYQGVVRYLVRSTTRPVTIGDVEIPAGDFVAFSIISANRDSDAIPDADQFNIDRPNVRGHLGYGLGAHTCLGISLARLEAKVAFDCLINRFPNLALSPEQGPLEYRNNLMIPGVKSLKVTL